MYVIVDNRVSNYRTFGRLGVKWMTASWVLYFLSYNDVVFRMTCLADVTFFGDNTMYVGEMLQLPTTVEICAS